MASSHRLSLCWVPFRGKNLFVWSILNARATERAGSLEIVKPDITSSTVIGTSCAILILLFLIQPLGTAKIGSAFAPIVIIWLLFNLSFGIYVRLLLHAEALEMS